MAVSTKRYQSLLVTYLKPQWRQTAVLIVLLFSSICLQLASPHILRTFIDTATTGGTVAMLSGIGLLFLAIALVTQLVLVAETYMAENIGWTATNQLRADMMLHCMELDPDFHNQHSPGELVERVDGDVSKLGNFFSRFVGQLLANGLLLIGVLIMSFGIDYRVGLALTAFAAGSILLLYALRNVGVPYHDRLRQVDADLFGFIEEHLSGTEDIRANGATSYVMDRLYRLTRSKLYATRSAFVVGSAAFNITIVLLAIGTAIGLGLGIFLFQTGRATIGTIYLIFAYTELLRRPIEQLSRQVEDLQQATASIGRVQDLLATRSAIVDGPGRSLSPGPLSVEFEHVSFSYGSDRQVLHDLSFTIPAGTTLGLLGRTGSGKTTITRLLFRLYDPTDGAVKLGGHDLRTLKVDDIRQRIGMVTQDIQLFHATVRDNLTLFDPSVEDDRVVAVLHELGLGPWHQRLAHGLDTMLAPDGTGLSAGEAQLLAFARVFLQNPDLVILDEASSRLDLATEQTIERALTRLLQNRTAIIIAHRLQTVQRVDAILIVEDGRIQEYDARETLIQNPDSRFSRLLRTGLEEVLA